MGGLYTVIGVPIYELSESAAHAYINVTMEVREREREGENIRKLILSLHSHL